MPKPNLSWRLRLMVPAGGTDEGGGGAVLVVFFLVVAMWAFDAKPKVQFD